MSRAPTRQREAAAPRLPARFTGVGAPPCPVAQDAVRLTDLSHAALVAVRRLRRDQVTCQACPHEETCQIRTQFNTLITTALTEVWEEWAREEAADSADDPC